MDRYGVGVGLLYLDRGNVGVQEAKGNQVGGVLSVAPLRG